MGVTYLSWDDEEFSWAWYWVFRAAVADRILTIRDVNDGHRSMALQALRVRQHGLYDRVRNPTGAAAPSPTAPHIRVGRQDHANDINTAVIGRFMLWLASNGVRSHRPVLSEPWHLEVLSEAELVAFARRCYARLRPPRFTRVEKRLMAAKLTRATRLALRAQARKIQMAARKPRRLGGWLEQTRPLQAVQGAAKEGVVMRLRGPVGIVGAVVGWAVLVAGLLLLVVLFENAPAATPKAAVGDATPATVHITGQSPGDAPQPAAQTGAASGHISATAASARRPSKLHVGPQGMALIEHFEGIYLRPYRDPVGIPTACAGLTGDQIQWAAPFPTTRERCRKALRRALNLRYEPPVRALFRPGGALRGMFNQQRFDALVSFAYNLGPGCVSTACPSMWAALRSRDLRRVASTMQLYVTGGGIVFPGLVRRRAAEAGLLLSKPVRFEQFMPKERRWIVRYDRIRRERRKPARQLEFQRLMRHQAQRIRNTAVREIDGWLTKRRRTRHDALARRTNQKPLATIGGAR